MYSLRSYSRILTLRLSQKARSNGSTSFWIAHDGFSR